MSTETETRTIDLDNLEALAEKATPGPWRHGPLFWEGWASTDDGGIRVFEVPHVYPDEATQPGVWVDPAIGRDREGDAAYIAALDPSTVRELIRLARLGAEVDVPARECDHKGIGLPGCAICGPLTRARLSDMDDGHDWACGRSNSRPDPLCAKCQGDAAAATPSEE